MTRFLMARFKCIEDMLWLKATYSDIYIFIAIVLDETSILVAVYFSMQNIYQSCDLGRGLGRSNVDVSQ